ncbi:TonB-dependent receptor plug domain-containing protein [Cystobacter ferrugineus]|uniref:Ligand-gated channel protein n=1 Tax=Cystobacter ferrugineus TaxID=83449 RepID=A0A1L9BJH1_9BACT|nr:TonB-dependent receptor [Cystobacter ferrugineus]OJH42411.1 ligand-gated channel protein [Cystobacter ferrugineus]
MRWSSLAGCLALGTSASVLAQPPAAPGPQGEPFRVPTVEVEEARPVSEPADSASRRDPSGALTVIDGEEGAGAARDTAALLSTAPGVVVQDSGGYGQSKGVVVRGASSNGTLVLLDGIPLNGAGGIADVSRVPVALAERIEVLRGGAGARYGSGGLGGVINIITRRPGESTRVAGELSYGSWDTAVGWLSATGPIAGNEVLLLLHGGLSRGNFRYLFDPSPTLPGDALVESRRANNDAHGAGGLLRLRRELGGGFSVDALGELSLDGRGLAGTAQNPSVDARQSARRGSATVRLAGALPGGGGVEARAYYRRDRLALDGGLWSGTPAQVQQVGSVEAEGRKRWGRHALSALVGVGGEAVSAAETAAASEGEPAWFRASVMAMDEVRAWDERLTIAPSVRVERAGPYTLWSPKLGASLLLPAGLELRANAGRAHRAPSFLELYVRQGTLLPNPALRPESALYADAAVVHRSEVSSASVGGYASLYEDLISYEAYPPGAARPYNFVRARVVGLEAEGEWRPHPFLSAALSYTLTVSNDLQRDGRFYLRELPYRPRHKLFARVLGGPRWLTGRVEVLAQSAHALSRDGVLTLPGRAFVHTGVSSTFGSRPELTVSLEVRNLFDARAEDFVGYPLPGRAVYVSVSGAFEPGRKTP